jgi:hypothetical protein
MSSQLSAQWAEPPWGAEPRIELGPVSQASALPIGPSSTFFIFLASYFQAVQLCR